MAPVSTIQQNEPAICIHTSPLSWTSFPLRPPQCIKQRPCAALCLPASCLFHTQHHGALVVKNPPPNTGDAGDPGSIPEWVSFPEEGHGSPLQYSCLESPTDRGAWRLQSMGSQRVGWDWTTDTRTHQSRISVSPNLPIHPTPLSPLMAIHFIFLCISPRKINNQSPS